LPCLLACFSCAFCFRLISFCRLMNESRVRFTIRPPISGLEVNRGCTLRKLKTLKLRRISDPQGKCLNRTRLLTAPQAAGNTPGFKKKSRNPRTGSGTSIIQNRTWVRLSLHFSLLSRIIGYSEQRIHDKNISWRTTTDLFQRYSRRRVPYLPYYGELHPWRQRIIFRTIL
jgi:hypothetical protein